MDTEFVLKNASIIEGSGMPPYKGHIHIVDGEIKAVHKDSSELPKNKVETIDLKGQTVMPGLIDLHTHIRSPELPLEYIYNMKSNWQTCENWQIMWKKLMK